MTRFRLQSNTAAQRWALADYPAFVLDQLSELGLVGDVEWAAVGHDVDPGPFTLPGGAGLGRRLSEALGDVGDDTVVLAGAKPETDPPWTVTVRLAPYHAPSDSLDGVNVLAVEFDLELDDEGIIAGLVDAFRVVAGAGRAQYSYLHPEESWRRLTALVGREPAFTTLQFPCFYWCNGLGQRVLAALRSDALDDLDVDENTTFEDGSRLIVMTNSPEAACTPEAEQRFVDLARSLRA